MDHFQAYAKGIFDKLPACVDALAYVGGGCLRSYWDRTPIKDYDLFFGSHEDWLLACQRFRSDPAFVETTKIGEETYPSFQRDGEPPFNLIGFRFHKSADALCSSFDFTCVAFVAERTEMYGVPRMTWHSDAIQDASRKHLVFQSIQHIDRVELRVSRYESYGYTKTKDFIRRLPECHLAPRSAAGEYQ